MQDITQIPFFFIIGRPRSGTTLIRTLLDAHPNVIVPPEYPVIPDVFSRMGENPRWDDRKRLRLMETFRKSLPFDFWKYEYLRINEDALVQALNRLPDNCPTRDVIKLFYYYSQSVFKKREILLLGDKNPVYALHTQRLMKWFPGARFLFITRDYRDNLVSMRKFDWEAPDVVLQAWRWKTITRMMLRLKRKAPDRVLMFRYEDLAAKPEEVFGEICSFLRIPFAKEVFDFHFKSSETNGFIDHETLLKYHDSLTRPVHTDTVGKWMQVLHPYEVRKADCVVGKTAEAAGYVRDVQHFNRWLYISLIPMQMYGAALYFLMKTGEYLPYALKIYLARILPYLVKIYKKFNN